MTEVEVELVLVLDNKNCLSKQSHAVGYPSSETAKTRLIQSKCTVPIPVFSAHDAVSSNDVSINVYFRRRRLCGDTPSASSVLHACKWAL
jgi:hypothetical protein